MRKTAFVVIALCLVLIGQAGWAQLSPEQEKRLKQLEAIEQTQKVWELEEKDTQNEPEEKDLKEVMQEIPKTGKVYNEETPSDEDIESIGRYQAIRMDSNAIFILDTQKGHFWVWVIQNDNTGQSAEFLFYQGRVVPGSKMGELIDRTYKE